MIDKEWQNEPDSKLFTHVGLPCRIMRADSTGCLCGYVGIPPDHLLRGLDYDESSDALVEKLEKIKADPNLDIRERGLGFMLDAMCGDVKPSPRNVLDIHGGITYSKPTPPGKERSKFWWFGFDCSHCQDYMPNMGEINQFMAKHMKETMCTAKFLEYKKTRDKMNQDLTYRNMEYVIKECKKLAEQLQAIK